MACLADPARYVRDAMRSMPLRSGAFGLSPRLFAAAAHRPFLPAQILRAVVFVACLSLNAFFLGAAEISRDEVKVLTVGNSFASDATVFLPKLAEAAGKKLVLLRANPGGCSLERHARHAALAAADPADPAGKLYKGILPGATEPTSFSLQEALESEHWDYVTIQQVSTLSFQPETFEPYAGELVGHIRKHAPQAEILIHQTWAYRDDWEGYNDGFTPDVMHQQASDAYKALATRYRLRIIPVGEAFHAARTTPLWKFQYPDPAFDYKNPLRDSVPQQFGSLHAGWAWRKDLRTGELRFNLDFKHGNVAGKFLGSAVFFEMLYGEDVTQVPFHPEALSPEQGASLKSIAHKTVEGALKNIASAKPTL
jgi:hypothetical protein